LPFWPNITSVPPPPFSVSTPLPPATTVIVTAPVAVPSETVTVIVAAPVFPAGVLMANVSEAPLPLKARLPFGTSAVLLP
jgi:hypothetical protein